MLDGKRLNPLEKLAFKLLSLTDIENRTLRAAVRQFAQTVPTAAKVLDVAAGLKPYQQYFAHCDYESSDFAEVQEFYGNLDDGRRENLAKRHTYVCPIDRIPVPDGTFDAVLCTQVLEHVPYPAAALEEIHRVLTDSGRLFVTVPQGFGIHGEPYNFFYFTKYGLELILRDAGFQVLNVRERGGYFYYLYDRLANAIPRIVVGYKKHMSLMILVLSPIHIFLAYLLGPALLLLEPLDKEKRFTLGYTSTALKQASTSDTSRNPIQINSSEVSPAGRL